MTIYSSILAWKILWTGESGGLQSMGLQRVGHNLATEHSNSIYKIESQQKPTVYHREIDSIFYNNL